MVENIISLTLKQQRNINDMTPEQVVTKLREKGFSISTKALYAYEAGTNIPKVPVFLALCDIYNIHDVMGSFGYEESTQHKAPSPSTYNATLCTDDIDWAEDQYEDFFKAPLMQKILLLVKWGIPSFTGYDEYMNTTEPLVLSDAEINLIKKYRRLSYANQITLQSVLNGFLGTEESQSSAKEA